MYRPCLLDRAQNSQPCASCGPASVLPSLPFGFRNLRQIKAALVLAKLAPHIHKTFSPVSRSATRPVLPIAIPPYPLQLPLGRKAKPCLWVFCCARRWASRDLRPFIPITGFISKSRNHPFEQIGRSQHHHGKVLFTMPSLLPVAVRSGCSPSRIRSLCLSAIVIYHTRRRFSRKKSCERNFPFRDSGKTSEPAFSRCYSCSMEKSAACF